MKFLLSFLLIATSVTSFSQWSPSSSINTPVCTAINNQSVEGIVKDGVGGFIVVWTDARNGNSDIYAQRVSASGESLWANNGIVICDASNDQNLPVIISDGSGGAVISWCDKRNNNNVEIYTQKIDSNGVAQWPNNGVDICNAVNGSPSSIFEGYTVRSISDNNGGAIISWTDLRNNNADLYIQHINALGIPLWTTNGSVVCNASGTQLNIAMVEDGTGGALMTWSDARNGNYDVYFQHINNLGAAMQGTNGMVVCNAASDQFYSTLINDGNGNAFIGWEDYRSGTLDIYAQKISGTTGLTQFSNNGNLVCGAVGSQYGPYMITDNNGGAILCWEDYRMGVTNADIYAQRMDASGNNLWTENGVVVCNETHHQTNPFISSDSNNGCVIVWDDARPIDTHSDLYAQKLDAEGITQWNINGIAISNAASDQTSGHIVQGNNGSTLIVWTDFRNGNMDIYATGIQSTGIPLLINLLNFEASILQNNVFLSWEISSDIKIKRFVIQRGDDGREFSDIGILTKVENQKRNYDFTDLNPLNGNNFYRLKIEDENGVVTFSNIKNVFFNIEKVASVFPNPAGNMITIKTKGEIENVKIIDLTGKIIKSSKIIGTQLNLDISDLQPGYYFCRLGNGTYPFIKQ